MDKLNKQKKSWYYLYSHHFLLSTRSFMKNTPTNLKSCIGDMMKNSGNYWMRMRKPPYINPSIHPSIHQSIHPSIHPYINPSIHPSNNLSSVSVIIHVYDIMRAW